MLGLTLREEFRGRRLKGTAIELSNDQNTGATQIAAKQFLEITYPTHDLLKGIEAVGPNQGRPVVVIGERGLGKSHLMAALFHAVTDPASTGAWLNAWATTLAEPTFSKIALRSGMHVIGESLHRHRYKFLWDVLFENHPHGTYIKGKWEGQGTSKTEIPSDKLIIELLENKSTMLLLDEFQTWYDGLTNTKQYPWKNWAFNFIQILSEIAKERPDLLVLVISVRNGGSDAYQQVHRVNPVAIDFKAGGSAERIQQDRRRMLLHRLFDNRLQIANGTIESLIAQHVAESFRLLAVPPAEQERKRREFTESWPYAPHLLRLLEEQVLIATDAQETRDLIRILANLYKSRGEAVPVLTAADFRLDDDTSGIGALLEAVANQHHRTLREKAQQNIISVQEARHDHASIAPHLQEIIGALWLRSIAMGNLAGAEPTTLQLDITRGKPVDDNAFQVELASLRQFLRAAGNWPDDLPSNDSKTLVVAGLDGSLDLLTPTDAEGWLGDVIKPAILSFQDEYEGEAALVFWLPGGGNRIKVQTASDEVCWLCHAPHGHQIDFGRILWGQANEYPQEILLRECGKPAGLFHLRIT